MNTSLNFINIYKMRNEFGISEKSYSILYNSFKNYQEIKQANIFGSRALGNYKKGSDIDLVLYGQDIKEQIVNELRTYLNQDTIIPYKIDLLIFDQIENQQLIDHINKCSKIFYRKQVHSN